MEGSRGRVRTPIRSFRDLEVYQRAQAAMAEVHRFVLTFPDHEKFGLVDQMRRASKSVGALISEGWGLRDSEKEFKNYLRRSLGSANEMESHLDTSQKLAYGDPGVAETLIREYHIIGGQLVRLRSNWRSFATPSSIINPPSSRRPEK